MNSMSREPLILTQQRLENCVLQGRSFDRSSVNNCTFREFTFQDCSFNRSGLIGSRGQKCTFERCQFKNVDLSSCTFTNCTFKECDFALADVSDNRFFCCQFEKTDFTGSTLKDNEFIEVNFLYISLCGSLTTLNTFRRATVSDSEFGNCTIDYNVYESCFFHNSYLNVEMLGTSFGLSLKDIDACKILILGREILEEDQTAIFCRTRNYFEDSGHYFECFIMDLNHSLNSLIPGIKDLGAKMRESLVSDSYISPNQLLFLFNLFKELYKRGVLAYLALYQFKTDLLEILNSLSPDAGSYEKLILLYNNLNLLHNSMMADLEVISDQVLPTEDKQISVRFTFAKKPDMPIDAFLEDCYIFVFDRPSEKRPTVLSEQTGSYIVCVQTTIYTLIAFRICTYLLVGSVKELVKLRANVSLLVGKKLPRKYYLEVTRPENPITIPQALAALLTGLLKKSLPVWLGELPVRDFSKENLQEIAEEAGGKIPQKNHTSAK